MRSFQANVDFVRGQLKASHLTAQNVNLFLIMVNSFHFTGLNQFTHRGARRDNMQTDLSF